MVWTPHICRKMPMAKEGGLRRLKFEHSLYGVVFYYRAPLFSEYFFG